MKLLTDKSKLGENLSSIDSVLYLFHTIGMHRSKISSINYAVSSSVVTITFMSGSDLWPFAEQLSEYKDYSCSIYRNVLSLTIDNQSVTNLFNMFTVGLEDV